MLSEYGVVLELPKPCHYIYQITNKVSNRSYIGQTSNIERRIMDHLTGRGSKFLLKDIVMNGISSFSFTVLDIVYTDNIDIDALEDSYIDVLGTLHPQGFNRRVNHAIEANGAEVNLNNIVIQAKHVFSAGGMKVFTIGELSQSRGFQTLVNIQDQSETQKLKLKKHFSFRYMEIMVSTIENFVEGQVYDLILKYNFVDDLFNLVAPAS